LYFYDDDDEEEEERKKLRGKSGQLYNNMYCGFFFSLTEYLIPSIFFLSFFSSSFFLL